MERRQSRAERSRSLGQNADGRNASEQRRRRHRLPERGGADDPEDRAGAENEQAQGREPRRRHPDRQRHEERGGKPGNRTYSDHDAERQSPQDRGRQKRAYGHSGAVEAEREADA